MAVAALSVPAWYFAVANGSDPFDFSEFGSPPSGPPAKFGPAPGPTQQGGFGPPPQRQSQFPSPSPFGQVPQFGEATQNVDPFGDATLVRAPRSLEQVRPPLLWLVLGAAVALIGLVLALVVGSHVWLAMTGWVLAGPLAIGALATFTIRDTGQRARPLYSFPSWLPWAYRGVLLLAMLGVAAGAWRIAEWAGRL